MPSGPFTMESATHEEKPKIEITIKYTQYKGLAKINVVNPKKMTFNNTILIYQAFHRMSKILQRFMSTLYLKWPFHLEKQTVW